MLAAALCTVAMSQAQDLPLDLANLKPYTLLIFESGERKREYTQDELAKMQAGHIANLVRLYEEKKSPVAGPFGDNGAWRGIVILDLPKDKVPAEFAEDPFVKDGLLKISLHTWTVHKDSFAWPSEDLGMAEYLFVQLKKGPTWSPEQGAKHQIAHLKNNIALSDRGLAALVGPMSGTPDWQGTFIFHGKDKEAVEKELQKDPMIQTGHLKAEFNPLWLGKGLFKKVKWN